MHNNINFNKMCAFQHCSGGRKQCNNVPTGEMCRGRQTSPHDRLNRPPLALTTRTSDPPGGGGPDRPTLGLWQPSRTTQKLHTSERLSKKHLLRGTGAGR